jgi:hypothetical protein
MLNRRDFIFGGALITTQLTGCGLGFLLRLAFRGRMIRGASRAGRFGRAATVASYGRGVAVAAQAMRIARAANSLNSAANSLNRIQSNLSIIRSEDSREVANIVGDDNGVACNAAGDLPLTYSYRDGKYLYHRSIILDEGDSNGIYCGYSDVREDGINKHFDHQHRPVGYCKVSKDSVEHFDKDGNLIGTSTATSPASGELLVRSPEMETEIDSLIRDSRYNDPDVKDRVQELAKLINNCSKPTLPDYCDDSHISIARLLQELERI